MKKIFKKIFKAPVVIFSAGVVVALMVFAFLQPRKSAVGMSGIDSPKTGVVNSDNPELDFLNLSELELAGMMVSEDSVTDWSIKFLPFTMSQNPDYPGQRFMLDLNGDGLTDYIRSIRYVYNSNINNSERVGEVYLNNGNGWTLVYDFSIDPTEPGMSAGCFTGWYGSWSNSSVYKESDWAWNMPVRISKDYYENNWFESFADLNGDGLPDYVWREQDKIGDEANYRECVYLNNGHGWDAAYRCVHTYTSNRGHTYYGDCAEE